MTPRRDAIVSLMLSLVVMAGIGIGVLITTRSRQTLLFWISGICFGYGIRIAVGNLRATNVQSETTQRIERAGEDLQPIIPLN